MKHIIYPEKQAGSTADSENASYPSSYLTDNDYRKKVWKATAGASTAKLTIPIKANGEVIALYNTNAQGAVCTIKTSTGGTVSASCHTLATTAHTYTGFWQEYTQQASSHTAEIVLTAATSDTVEAGIVRAGEMVTLADPKYGISESKRDYSVTNELRNGAKYTKKGEIVRTFSYSMMLDRTTQVRDLMDVYEYYGPDPFAMLITDDVDDNHWTVFGAFKSEPTISHDSPNYSTVSVSVEEAV